MKKINPERETIICINDADLAEGWFRFGTSRKDHFDKLNRRVGSNILSTKISKDAKGNPVYWDCKVAKCALRTNFGVGVRGKGRGNVDALKRAAAKRAEKERGA